jgi:hypothetical protein
MHQHSRTQIEKMYDDQFFNENLDSDEPSSFNIQNLSFDEPPTKPKNASTSENENQLKHQIRKPLRLSRENLAIRNSVLDLDQQEHQNQIQRQPQIQSNKIPTKKYQSDASIAHPTKNSKFQKTSSVKPLKF